MNGLHSCKPGNEPQIGQIKTFTVIHNSANRSKKAWTKIKSAPADQGGTPYKITAVKPTGYTDSYGNVSFNLDIEPANGSAATQREASPTSHVASKGDWDDRSSRIERQHSQEMMLRYFTLRPDLIPKEISADDMAHMMREMTSWFQRDVGHVPNADAKAPTKSELAADPDDTEIPF